MIEREAVLIHGWDPKYYNNRIGENVSEGMAWPHRSELIERLGDKYDVQYYNLPGFCGVREPNGTGYDVEDFADNLSAWKKERCRDARLMIGYSFGGAVLLSYKVKYKDPTPAVLISPALLRSESRKSRLAGFLGPLVPRSYVAFLRHVYQYTASEYYRLGTPFLRSTYDTIVRRDLRPLLWRVKRKELLLIYGENDEATPWGLVKDAVRANGISYHIVNGGGHGIGQTHPEEVVRAIDVFLSDENKG